MNLFDSDDTKLTGRIITKEQNYGKINKVLHLNELEVDIPLEAVNSLVSPRYLSFLSSKDLKNP